MILNGTPITRNEADLYSQFYILDWRILGYKSYWSFSANHLEIDDSGRIRKCLNTDYLVEKIAPYSYQIKKSECLDLPDKTYETIYYDITYEQDNHYEEVADTLLFSIDELKPYTIYRFFTALQMVVSGYKVVTETGVKEKRERTWNGNIKSMKRRGLYLYKSNFFRKPEDNPRIQCLLDVVENITDKIIIFCKYTDEINTIVKLINAKYGENVAVPYYGELNEKQRQNNIDLFQSNSRFLVANKTCAGYGLNLQFCSYVIFYSNDFDFGTRAQAEDRVHRIGQNNNVHIIDICASYTLDEKILRCLRGKENLLDTFKNQLDKMKDKNEILEWIGLSKNKNQIKCKEF